ncbi:conjugation system SOS inhibitor PsiB family protein [Yersinia enterocolitica]
MNTMMHAFSPVLSLPQLEAMDAVELEQFSERGQAFRHALSCSVLALLAIPDAWWCEAEFGSEFGGLYPVTLRFTPKKASLRPVEWYLSSAGQEYPYWQFSRIEGEQCVVTDLYCDCRFDRARLNALLAQEAMRWSMLAEDAQQT